MEIDLTPVLKDMKGNPLLTNELDKKLDDDGNPIPICDAEGNQGTDPNGDPLWQMDRKPLTLRDAIINGLNYTPAPNQQGAPSTDAKDKMRRWKLMLKIDAAGDTIALEAEDVTLIKEGINKAYPAPIVYGQACDLLDPVDDPETPEA